jgi:hypothetical protein
MGKVIGKTTVKEKQFGNGIARLFDACFPTATTVKEEK